MNISQFIKEKKSAFETKQKENDVKKIAKLQRETSKLEAQNKLLEQKEKMSATKDKLKSRNRELRTAGTRRFVSGAKQILKDVKKELPKDKNNPWAMSSGGTSTSPFLTISKPKTIRKKKSHGNTTIIIKR